MRLRPVPRLPLRDMARLFDLRDTPRWLAALPDIFATHGDLVRIPLPRKPLLATRDPKVMAQILQSPNWDKRGDLHKYHRMLMGDGLVTARSHEPWRRRRRAIQPLFDPAALPGYLPRMEEGLAAAIADWAPGAVVKAHQAMRDATTRVNFACFLREDFAPHLDALHAIMDVLSEPQGPIDLALPDWVPTRAMRAHRRILSQLDEIVSGVVRKRRSEGLDRGDYLDALLRAAASDPKAKLTDYAIRDEVVTLLVAGHETTASGLAWTLYELAERPDLQDRIATDAAALDKATTNAEKLRALSNLTTVTHAVWEGLRLYPPVMVFVPRENAAPTTLAGFKVPARSLAFLFPYAAMRHPGLWPGPDRFNPDRYAQAAATAPPAALWMPFASGRRKCPGEAFATAEMRLFLTRICTRWRFTRAAPATPRMVNGALMPAGGVRLRLEAR